MAQPYCLQEIKAKFIIPTCSNIGCCRFLPIYTLSPKVSKLLSGSCKENSFCPQGFVCKLAAGCMVILFLNID